ncbi:MAG: LapA family protein [Nitrosomonadales bacterium]|nr:LapA family protein [Nitrosomonadales bacterium]
MRVLSWLLRAFLFFALLGFAVKNDQPITLRYFFGYEWQSSLVVVLLLFFSVGTMVGVLAMLVNVLRQRREIARLERDIKTRNKLAGIIEEQQTPIQPF